MCAFFFTIQDLAVKDLISLGMKVTRFESISRQFNFYGFRKHETGDTCSIRYVNKSFTRDNEALQAQICRRTREKPKCGSLKTMKDVSNAVRTLHERYTVLEGDVAHASKQTRHRLERFQERFPFPEPSSASFPTTEDDWDWPFDDMPLYDYGNGCVSPTPHDC